MQQPELRERIEGRRLDVEAADYLSTLPYTEFLGLWFTAKDAWTNPTLAQAAMIRCINTHYENETLKRKLEYLEAK